MGVALTENTLLKRSAALIAVFLRDGRLALYQCATRQLLEASAGTLALLGTLGELRRFGEVRPALMRALGDDSGDAADQLTARLLDAHMLCTAETASEAEPVDVFAWAGFGADGSARDLSEGWFAQKFEPNGDLRRNAYRHVEFAAVRRMLGTDGDSLKGRRVLDLGCGSGFYSVYCAEEGARVTGVDRNPHLLERARALARERGVEVEFRELDLRAAGALDAVGRDFDRILCVDTLVHLLYSEDMDPAATERTLAAAGRILEPSGRLVVVDPHPVFSFLPCFGDVERPFTVVSEYRLRSGRTSRVMPPLEVYLGCFLHAGFRILRLCEPTPEAEYAETDPSSFFFYRQFPGWIALELEATP